MTKWKLTDAPAFSALINFIKQTKTTSDANAFEVSSLREDFQELAEQTAQTFSEVDTALTNIDSEKLDKTSGISAIIPVSGWGTDTSIGDYPKYYDLSVTGVTANDRASVIISPVCIQTAVSCGICPTCETLAGIIRIRSAKVPTEAISVQYWIEKGKV